MTISWIYRYWCDIVEFFIFAFDDDIEELVIFDDDWHLNIFLILPILSISSFFFSVAHDMMISIIFLQLMMWPYSALGLIILLLMTSTINRLLWRYPVIQHFYVLWRYPAFLDLSSVFRRYTSISFILDAFVDNSIDELYDDIPADLSLIPLRHH